MTSRDLEDAEDLVGRMVEFSESPESRGLYFKAINAMGLGRTDEALGEVKMRWNEGSVSDKAKYLTKVLVDWMDEYKKDTPASEKSLAIAGPMVKDLSPDLKSLDELRARRLPAGEEGEERTLAVPLSKRVFQWVKFVNNDFFTLSNVPQGQKWDRVQTRIKVDGRYVVVPLVRGKQDKDDDPRGILTVEHARILGAIEHIWVLNGCSHTAYNKSGVVLCFTTATIRKIAELLGVTNFGGSEFKQLKKKILSLDKTGYYLDLKSVPEFRDSDVEDIGFKFMGDVQVENRNESGKKETVFRFVFSQSYSKQLIDRRVVSRPLDLLKVRGDIAFKLYQHIYPIMVQKEPGQEYSVELKQLVTSLGLPKAEWHLYKSQRKRGFEKAVREVNGKRTTEGKIISVQIIKGLNDFMLAARLIDAN